MADMNPELQAKLEELQRDLEVMSSQVGLEELSLVLTMPYFRKEISRRKGEVHHCSTQETQSTDLCFMT